MKQFITPIACVMLAALTSCSNDKVLSEATPKDRIDVSTAFGGVKTKAVSNDDELQNTSFVKDALINVYLKEHGDGTLAHFEPIYVFKKIGTPLENGANMQINNSGQNAYYPLSGKAVDAYAFYPAIQDNPNYNILDKMSAKTFTVLTNQANAENYRKCDLMFGSNKYYVDGGIVKEYEDASFTGTSKADNPVKLIFKHQLSKIIVRIQPGGGLIESNLTGATITMFGPKPEVKITTNSKGITLGDIEGDAPGGYNLGTYSSNGNAAIVIPQEINANTDFIKITLSSENGSKTYKYKLSSLTTFESGKSYTYTLKLTSGGLDVTTQIGDWSEQTGDGDGTANIE